MTYSPIAHKRPPACACLDLSPEDRQRILAAMLEAGQDSYAGSIDSVAGPMLDAALEEMRR